MDDARRAVEALPTSAVPVAAGGDGTVGMVVAAVLEAGGAGRTVGLLPLGTANLLARDLGMRSVGAALEGLFAGTPRAVDVMRTDRGDAPVALVSLSTGFEGRFVARYDASRRYGRPIGALAALTTLAAAAAVGGPGRPRGEGSAGGAARRPGGGDAGRGDTHGAGSGQLLEIDGQRVVDAGNPAYSYGLYNTTCYAGGFVMAADADLGDGIGEAAVYRTRAAYVRSALDGLRGGRGVTRPGVLRRPWTSALIASDGVFQVDGEVVPGGEIRVELVPAGVRILTPSAR